MTKQTKMDRLQAALAEAKAHLAAKEARLRPLIVAEEMRVAELRRAYEEAERAAKAAYALFLEEERKTMAALFPQEKRVQLVNAIRVHVSAQFPAANIEVLASKYRSTQVETTATVIAAHKAANRLARAYEKAKGAWNVASNKRCLLTPELAKAEKAVRKLEKEIERLLQYREAAKERRAIERRGQLVDKQTAAARALLKDFVFDA
jgi:hypothetical protein